MIDDTWGMLFGISHLIFLDDCSENSVGKKYRIPVLEAVCPTRDHSFLKQSEEHLNVLADNPLSRTSAFVISP